MACHHTWCVRDHSDPGDADIHENTPTHIPAAYGPAVTVLVTYRDGHHAARLFVSAETELDAEGTILLRTAVSSALDLMMSVKPTPALAVAR